MSGGPQTASQQDYFYSTTQFLLNAIFVEGRSLTANSCLFSD
jgi:hypothetical protein